MTGRRCAPIARIFIAAMAVVVCGAMAFAEPSHDRYAGRLLADALKMLQARGLKIVFSSEIVTSEMRVAVEPRGATSRQVLDELLLPHQLAAREGPGQILRVVRVRRASARTAVTPPSAVETRGVAEPHRELVTVTAMQSDGEPGAVSSARLRGGDLQQVAGVVGDDPLRAIQVLGATAVGDDYHSELSVRGSSYRHVGKVVDGVPTSWLRHAAYGRGDSGSVAMLSSAGVDRATLEAGAHAQRHSSHLGAELDLTLREGSREATSFHGSVATTHATVAGEGPLGRLRRGSWAATIRNSHVDWPFRVTGRPSGTVLGFSDAMGKLAYDIAPSQQLTVSMIAGRSSVDELDERRRLGDGFNHVGLATVAWRSTFGARSALTQRVAVVSQTFGNLTSADEMANSGDQRAYLYRADFIRVLPGGLLETGAHVQRIDRQAGGRRDQTLLQSAYAHFSWTPARDLKVAPGIRLDAGDQARPAAAPWVLAEWSPHPNLTLRAATGQSNQFAGVEPAGVLADRCCLSPERATHLDVGVAYRLSPSLHWQATWFRRWERDVWGDDRTSWLTSLATPESLTQPLGARMTGTSQGLELRVSGTRSRRLSGSVAYSYGRTRYTDPVAHETFWGDFDQRHAVNASTVYRLSNRTTIAATFRSGSNFPLAGYLAAHDGRLWLGANRNELRLPGYARLDVRATRSFVVGGRRVTLFADVINLFDRANLRATHGTIQPGTGEAVGFTERLLPRLPTAGLAVEF